MWPRCSEPRALQISAIGRMSFSWVRAAQLARIFILFCTIERIARNGPLGLQATKELMRLAVVDADKAREKQAEWQPKVFNSDDAKEGATAFIEKRDPVWRGR